MGTLLKLQVWGLEKRRRGGRVRGRGESASAEGLVAQPQTPRPVKADSHLPKPTIQMEKEEETPKYSHF